MPAEKRPELGSELESILGAQGFVYQGFHEALTARMNPHEIHSLNVLGPDFFKLVDQIAYGLFVNRYEEARLLGVHLNEFLWELQVFANQFLRRKCSSVLKLRSFCRELVQRLNDDGLRHSLALELNTSYEEQFYVSECQQNLLN